VKRIELTIERVVLHGFARANAPAVRAALESELARLLRSGRALPEWNQHRIIDRVDGGTMSATGHSGSRDVGTGVARAVHKGLKP
jgi:hypothetical protein